MPIFFRITELEGPGEASLELKGPAAALAGPELTTEGKGSRNVPLGSDEATLSTTAIDLGQTEFSFSWSASNLAPSLVVAQGLEAVARPESLALAFDALAARARLCLVELPGGFARRGVVRKVSSKLGRGYGRDPATGDVREGVDVDCSVTLDWAGAFATAPEPPDPAFALTGEELAGDVGDSLSGLASAAADADALSGDFLEQIDSAIGNVQLSGAALRQNLRGVGAIARAPSAVALKLSAAARSFGNACSDADALLSETPEIYQSAGQSMADLGRSKARSGAISGKLADSMEALALLFAALDARSPRSVPVRPGQSLGDVARAELGARDRWPELAAHNGLGGQVVPPGVFSIEVPETA